MTEREAFEKWCNDEMHYATIGFGKDYERFLMPVGLWWQAWQAAWAARASQPAAAVPFGFVVRTLGNSARGDFFKDRALAAHASRQITSTTELIPVCLFAAASPKEPE